MASFKMNLRFYDLLIGIVFISTFLLGPMYAFKGLADRLNDLFIASLGLLAFSSIFYGAKLFNGKTIKELIEIMRKKQNKKIIARPKAFSEKQKESILNEMLYLNKRIFLSVICYLFSIMFYLLPKLNWTILLQITTFWLGLVISILVVSSWFVTNEIDLK